METGMRLILLLAALLLPPTRAAGAAPQTFPSSAGNLAVEIIAGGLMHPWSLAFLPDGRMLVSERPGRLRIVTRAGQLSPPLAGLPGVYAQSQAGLMDVMLGRDFEQNRTVYFCYAEPTEDGGRIAVAHGRLEENGRTPRLVAVTTIFRQQGPVSHGLNIGCRMVQADDGNLFVTLGDHFSAADMAQTLDNHIGKIVRIRPDGTAPPDNPFVGKQGALPEIWAYGLRNAEGLAFNPADGKLWEQEHGPQGGDEINIIEKGKNYGWPKVSYGVNYDGTPVGTGKSRMPRMQEPVWHWTPSIAPSGMAFYTGELFTGWKGSLINGALKFELLSRLSLKGDSAVKEERLLQGLRERIRDVRQGPDGALYLLTDNGEGRILRVTPAK
jgi:glucose/arabinose dehydrogenase